MTRLAALVLGALLTVPGGAAASRDRSACWTSEVRGVVGRFVRAFNAGDLKTLDRVFAPAGDFRWYSTNGPGERLGARAYDRRALVPYFRRRHAEGERLTLRTFRFNGNSGGYGHFEYRLTRQATDLPPTPYHGKGAVLCVRRPLAIAVWSMGAATTPG